MAVKSVYNFIFFVTFHNIVFSQVHELNKLNSIVKYPFIPLINEFPVEVETSESAELLNRIESDETRISEIKCQEYIKGSRCEFEKDDFETSFRKVTRIHEFPHVAFIGRNITKSNKILYSCTGSLISPTFVLTAASCLSHKQHENKCSFVTLGDHNIDAIDDSIINPLKVPIKNVHIHPDYKWPNKYNNIALLELANSVKFSSKIRPACLWTKNSTAVRNNAVLTTMGSDIKKDISGIQKLSLVIISDKECNISMSRFINKNWRYGVDDTQVCAGEATENGYHCKSVLGSPMQYRTQYKNGCAFHIAAVTSFKFYPNCIDHPIVLTKVFRYLDWIENIVWPYSKPSNEK